MLSSDSQMPDAGWQVKCCRVLTTDNVYVSLSPLLSGLASESDVSVAPTIPGQAGPAQPGLQTADCRVSCHAESENYYYTCIFIGMKAGTITEYYSLGVQLDIQTRHTVQLCQAPSIK